MYKYLGLSLVAFAAIMMIPAQEADSFIDTSMYGMAILSVQDSTGNTLFTNTVHNEVLNVATNRMLANMFEETNTIIGAAENVQVNGICLTNAASFAATDTITATTFSGAGGGGDNTLDAAGSAGASCKTVVWTITNDITLTGATTNFAAGGTNVPDATTITGFATCDIGAASDVCLTTSDIVSAIATSVTLGTGETVDITYVLTLD